MVFHYNKSRVHSPKLSLFQCILEFTFCHSKDSPRSLAISWGKLGSYTSKSDNRAEDLMKDEAGRQQPQAGVVFTFVEVTLEDRGCVFLEHIEDPVIFAEPLHFVYTFGLSIQSLLKQQVSPLLDLLAVVCLIQRCQVLLSTVRLPDV